MKIVTTIERQPGDKTITFSELKRLSFCNSKNLPKYVILGGQLKHWVGIGWIDHDNSEATGDEPFVIDDDEKPPKKKRTKPKKKRTKPKKK